MQTLRAFHEEWRRVRALIDSAGTETATDVGRYFAERLKEKYGSGVDPAISLDVGEEEAGDLPSSELGRRLVGGTYERSRYRLLGEIAHGGTRTIAASPRRTPSSLPKSSKRHAFSRPPRADAREQSA